MTIEEIIQCAEKGESFHVPPELMPDYIRWLYTTHRCVHDFLRVRVESVSRGDIVLSMPVTADFIRAHPIEGQLRLHGQLRHNGGRMLTLRGEIFGHQGEHLADMDITMTVVGRLPEVPETW